MRSNQAKHKTAPKGSPIFRRAIVVMLTLVLSIACYGVTVFAWFQSEVVNSNNTISSGSYTITVDIKGLNTDNPVLGEDGGYTLEEGKGYSVTLTATGKTSGYCEITSESATWNTMPIKGGTSFTLTIYPETTAVYFFKTVWGTALVKDGLPNNYVIGTEPTEQSDATESSPTEDAVTPPTEEPTTSPAENPTIAPTEGETTPPTEAPTTEITEGETTAATEVPTTTEAVTETTQPPVQEMPAEGEQ